MVEVRVDGTVVHLVVEGSVGGVLRASYLVESVLATTGGLRPDAATAQPLALVPGRNMLAEGPAPAAVLLPAAASLLLLAGGWALFRRRDLR